MQKRPRLRRLAPVLGLVLWLLVVACANLVPQNGWDAGAGPVVPHDSFPADCSLCHTGGNWQTIRADFTFDHGARTGVVLQGAHATASCLLCHNDRGPVQQYAARGCAGCHADPHLTRLGANCKDCHEERSWYPREAILVHDRTRFPLVGSHAATACFRCHPGAQVGNFAGAPVQCEQCHEADYLRTTNPNHAQVSFPRDCDQCHLPFAWSTARFDHPSSFPLSFGHAGRRCGECHTTPNSFTGLSTTCSSCHSDDYAAAPLGHAAAGFGTDCTRCHTTRTWSPADWQHPADFPLTLGHAGRQCTQCHQNQVYSGTSSSCVSCHQGDYLATATPSHTAAGYSTNCVDCHSTASWSSASFTHTAAFPLSFGHAGRQCSECHQNQVFAGTSAVCSSCHLDNYQATTNPNHTNAGYSTDCTGCHSTVSWLGAGVAHPSTFPLTNSHQRACTSCHTGGVYTGLSTACASCHLQAYQTATDPPHLSFGMSQQCQQCHNTTAWSTGNWNHQFPINSGNHSGLACFDCHNNPANRPAFSCIDCHEHRQTAMNNKHQGVSGYSWTTAACYQCHPTGHE